MIKLIIGKKGSGKTKVLLDAVNQAIENTEGSVVFVDNSGKHSSSIEHSVRMVDTVEYKIDNSEKFEGFISGILAGNYDITYIFVDSILNIIGRDFDKFGSMLDEIDKILKNVIVMFTVSADINELPESVTKYA